MPYKAVFDPSDPLESEAKSKYFITKMNNILINFIKQATYY